MRWISTKKKMPKKSGDYMACIFTHSGRPIYDVLGYSKKHKAFCASDILPDAPYAMHVDYWAKIKPVKKKGDKND